MKIFLIYAAAMAAGISMYQVISPIALGIDKPILAIAQQHQAAMPLAQAQALAARYQAQAAAIRQAEAQAGVTP